VRDGLAGGREGGGRAGKRGRKAILMMRYARGLPATTYLKLSGPGLRSWGKVVEKYTDSSRDFHSLRKSTGHQQFKVKRRYSGKCVSSKKEEREGQDQQGKEKASIHYLDTMSREGDRTKVLQRKRIL